MAVCAASSPVTVMPTYYIGLPLLGDFEEVTFHKLVVSFGSGAKVSDFPPLLSFDIISRIP